MNMPWGRAGEVVPFFKLFWIAQPLDIAWPPKGRDQDISGKPIARRDVRHTDAELQNRIKLAAAAP